MEDKTETREEILMTIREKCVLKQDVYGNIIENFKSLKQVLKKISKEMSAKMAGVDDRIVIDYRDKGEFEAHLRVAGDVLIFHMHTNVFLFDQSHSVWKTSYLKENSNRAFCGIINVYNFLSDSFKYNRPNDMGYMIARIFINRDNHFMVQGKKKLGVLFNDMADQRMDEKRMEEVINEMVLYTLEFDLYTPPYNEVQEVTVGAIRELSSSYHLATAKRLGFKFVHEADELVK